MNKGIISIALFVAAFFFLMTANASAPGDHPVASFTLTTEMKGEKRLFVGVGGTIDHKINPDLFVNEWEVVEVTLISGDNLNHHIVIPDFHVMSETVSEKGKKTRITFVPFKNGGFSYYCTLENHRKLGMEGRMVVVEK